MKKYVFFLVLIQLFLSCSNMNKKANSKNLEPLELTEIQSNITNKGNEFTLNLLKEINLLEEESKNIFLSPFSASLAFSMVSAGAEGETQNQILKALSFNEYSQQEINEYYKFLIPKILDIDKKTKIKISNSLWTAVNFPIKKSYISLLKNDYFAESFSMPVNLDNAVNEINNWCNKNTEGLIKKMVDKQDIEGIKLLLANALYFKGTWQNKFNISDTYPDNFYNYNNTTTEIKYMFRLFNGSFYKDNECQAITLPYGNGSYIMTIVLPTTDININDFVKTLNINKLNNWQTPNNGGKIRLSLPKFNVDYKTEDKLDKAMSNMGMILPFSNSANFSGISNFGLCIDKAMQNAVIKVNEEGTEAAAVTTIGVRLTSIGPTNIFDFKVNKPFLYFISESNTGAVLFIGKQVKF